MESSRKHLYRSSLLLFLLAVTTVATAQTPPTLNQCRRAWVVNTVQEMNFGGFSVEAGTANITMNSLGGLSTSGLVTLSTSLPVTAWTITADNTLDAYCATYGFALDWQKPPQPLTGPGSQIPLNNVRISVPAYGLNDVTLPQTVAANPGNTIPFTITLYGEIAVTSPQTAGEYSRQQSFLFFQSVRRNRARASVYATSFVPLSIAETVAMNFGTLAGGSFPGTVILNTSNGRFVTGDAQIVGAGLVSSASFQIFGEPNQSYSLVYGNGTLANAGGQQMSITNFTDNSSGSLPGAGNETFQVGGTLNLGAGQPAGTYSTTNVGGSPYSITINYN